MKKKEYEEIMNKICPICKKYVIPKHIESISLNDGMIYKPDWINTRIMCDKKNIYLLYGDIVPYGARLPIYFAISYDRLDISFPGLIEIDTNGNGEFRQPKTGDILVYTKDNHIVCKSLIMGVHIYSDMTKIFIATPISGPLGGLLSFYDPKEENSDCIKTNKQNGIYLKFIPHNKKYDCKIPFKKIKNISFKD